MSAMLGPQMSLARCAGAVALAALSWPGAVAARDLTGAEAEALEVVVEGFDTAMRAQDWATIVGAMPPRIRAHAAAEMGFDDAGLVRFLATQLATTMQQVEFISFGFDLAGAEHQELADGTPYVLIPTETVMELKAAGRMAVRSHTLALLDGGGWYLVSASRPQELLMLTELYPEFAGVEIPRGTMEALD